MAPLRRCAVAQGDRFVNSAVWPLNRTLIKTTEVSPLVAGKDFASCELWTRQDGCSLRARAAPKASGEAFHPMGGRLCLCDACRRETLTRGLLIARCDDFQREFLQWICNFP
jgi:hypothetical protein